MAERHVAQGERHIIDQERILTDLRLRSQPTDTAEELLRQFNDLLGQHRAHRDQIKAQLDAHG